jgi:hypothetical protein
VPLFKIQTDILRLIAKHRDPESYVAGSTPLTRDTSRYSGDIDVFHDREERVGQAATQDITLLREHGYLVQWIRPGPGVYAVQAEREGAKTKLEWVSDSDFRFFPTIPDEVFGYVLHLVDLATNKVAAAYGRQEPRDVVDLLTIDERILPLGAVVWASAGKALGFTPEGIINEIRRNARYSAADFLRIDSDPPIDPAATMTRLREVLSEAEAFVSRMPTDRAGLLFLKDGHVVQPDPDRLVEYQTHGGRNRGHWPGSPEITAAMFEHYNKKPNANEPKP